MSTTTTANARTTNIRTATQAERRKARAVGISAAIIVVMLVFAITFTTLTLTGRSAPVGGPPGNNNNNNQGNQPMVFYAPITGEFTILKGFCDVDVQYNATLRQWRSHRAIAIGAAAGTPVVATYAGTIYSIRNTVYGTEVTINHGNNLQTVFRSLDRNTNVSQGDQVQRCQRIGTVGTTSTVEFTNTPHVRVEVLRDGRRIDPATYIDFGDK